MQPVDSIYQYLRLPPLPLYLCTVGHSFPADKDFSCKYYCFVQIQICVTGSMLFKILKKKLLRYETTGSKSKCLCTFRFIKPKANWFLFRIMLLIFSLVCLSCFLLDTTPPAFFLTYSPKVDMSTS